MSQSFDTLLLSITQYGINLLDISTKLEQCQVTIRKNLKESPNEDTENFSRSQVLAQISNTTHFSPLEKAKQRRLLD